MQTWCPSPREPVWISTVTMPGGEPERLGGLLVEHRVDALQLDEVVARADRPELTGAPLAGPLGDGGGVGARQAATRLGGLQVVVRADAVLIDERARALRQQPVERRGLEPQAAAPAGARRDPAGDLVHERLATVAELVGLQAEREQPHAAVDVVADPARRDDAVRHGRRDHAAHREAVPLVDVRHRERRVDDPGQCRRVLQLLEGAVVRDRGEELFVCEDARGHAHVGTRLHGDLPDHVPDPAHPRQTPCGSVAARLPTGPGSNRGRTLMGSCRCHHSVLLENHLNGCTPPAFTHRYLAV